MSIAKQRWSFRYKTKKIKRWHRATGPSKRWLSKTRTHFKKSGAKVETIRKIKKPYYA